MMMIDKDGNDDADDILVELLGLLRWKAEPNKVFHCIDNLLKLDGLEIMKVCLAVYLHTAHLFASLQVLLLLKGKGKGAYSC